MMKNEAAARTPDDGALYALGNGLIVAYGHGAEWEQVFGTPYTSPTALSLKRLSDAPYAPPRRAPARGVWVHETDVGTLEDTLANGGAIACLARRWRVSSPSRWRVGGRGFALTRDADLFPGCADAYLLTIPGGSPAYNWYPTHAFQYMQLVFTGGCRSGQSGDAIEFEVFGEGALFVASGADYPACIAAARAGLALGFDGMAAQNAASDAAFLSARRKNAFPVDEAHPRTRAVQAAADDVALLIRSHQGAEGGVLAGSNYHMGYVRDQYGVARGLLAMGCFDEAKAILRFYQEVFRVSGAVRNAQGIGVPDMFHLHEDDDSEITGYLVCQICDMLDATGDRALFDSLAPLAEWALRAQAGRLHRDMMP
ncbi:MAG: hypothetical protein GX558_07425, partial [Clostridiales bacterium]|nr:hypothetical protein [Clostridiales bacterium]